MNRILLVLATISTLFLAACRTAPTYQQANTYPPAQAVAIIQRAFEQQTPGLRPLEVKVSENVIRMLYEVHGRQSAYTIEYGDITELALRHRKRYAVTIFYALQSGTDYRKLEFDTQEDVYEFMDAINSLR